MSTRITVLVSITALLIVFAVPEFAAAQEAPAVIQVVAVDVDPGSQAAYLERLSKAQAIFKRLGLPALRVWFSSLSGPNTGSIVIAVEYTDDVTRAQGVAKLAADAEWQKWIAEMQQWGKSDITSNSLLVELALP
jgi:hypothetical protein